MIQMRKFKTLITRQGSGNKDDKSPTDEVARTPSPVEPIRYKSEQREFANDPAAEAEIIDSIEKEYFNDEDFDGSEFELLKVPELEKIELSKLTADRDRLRRQRQAVSKKVSDVVLENQSSYSRELQRVTEQLAMAKQGFTVASLSILANFRRRQQLLSLMKSLHTIKTLQQTDVRLREMLEEEDYPGAIQLCLECQKAASTFRHYKCISELSSKLQDTLEMIEEQLDQALAKTCMNFDVKHYEKVQTAYTLLGKTQTAMDQLHMHFTSAIHNSAFTIVVGYVELMSGSEDTNFQKMQYKDLCSHVTTDTYIPCLVDLCKALWEVMKSYYKTIEWHEANEDPISPIAKEQIEEAVGTDMEASFNRRYIKTKLGHGLTRIWQDVQQKVKIFLLGTDLSNFKYDDFIHVLDLVNRLIRVGEEFCGSKSESLHDSVRQQSLNYFKNYHRSRLDELQMFLENEGWELCPVKPNFTITNLHEFRFVRLTGLTPSTDRSNPSSPSIQSQAKDSFFNRFGDHGSPFDRRMDEEEGEEVIGTNGVEDIDDESHGNEDSDDSDVPDELKQDFIDELTEEKPMKSVKKRRSVTKGPVPILANTTLNVLRLFGKYMQMMTVLKPIAFDVVLCMSQLFDYYLFAVYTFFATDMERIGFPHVSPIVELTGVEQLHGLAERIVGTDSLVFLAEQFQLLQPHLESVIPSSKKPFLQQFYSQTVSVASELRRPVYRGVASRCIFFERILQLMSTVKWDIKEIMSQHSTYVDILLQDFVIFSARLDEVGKRVSIPVPVYNILWGHLVRLANRTFVEGFASAKKCSNEGRALMQLDFQQFLLKLEKLTEVRPIPDKEFVETYVKAYYLSEADMEQWIKDHREYSIKQLLSLVNCAVSSKKARQRLTGVVEELERTRAR
ncbi:syndetin-like [Acanthaster planci]|uniref:Syndetin-like n=1 Tax=Acanthaster planci TaxID=133434 RepID=A0A8B7ZW38_ACAPL|nr:syndetin-like [Acanthaster planci]